VTEKETKKEIPKQKGTPMVKQMERLKMMVRQMI
jgi:hypothetical protein